MYLKEIFSMIKRIFEFEFWFGSDGADIVNTIEKKPINKILDKSKPEGYVMLILKNISLDELYSDYGVTFTYIKVLDKYYVRTIHILESKLIFDCHNDGSNETIAIHRENENKLNLIISDIYGELSIRQIVGGKLIS